METPDPPAIVVRRSIKTLVTRDHYSVSTGFVDKGPCSLLTVELKIESGWVGGDDGHEHDTPKDEGNGEI